MSRKICQNCGSLVIDGDFCPECGTKLNIQSNGFLDNINDRVRLFPLILSFITLGAFLLIGSLFWGIFTSRGIIGFQTHVLLTVILAVFAGGIVKGYLNCADNSYIIPNFFAYFGTIAAVILGGVGVVFTLTSAFTSALSSVFSSSSPTSGYGSYSSAATGSDTNMYSTIVNNFIIDIFILILLIPAAAYLGIYVGYVIKNQLD